MKYLYLILFVLIFSECNKEEYLGDLDPHEYTPTQEVKYVSHAYIYDERLASLSYKKCHIIGTINGYEVNRACMVQKGYINIGSMNLYPENECYVEITVMLDKHPICYIIEKKKIVHN